MGSSTTDKISHKGWILSTDLNFAGLQLKRLPGAWAVGADSYFLNHFDCGQQVQTEVNEGPVDTFFLVLFLLEHEHVMVKELLQSLVSEINAKLFESVVLET